MLVHPEIGTTPALPLTGSLVELPRNFIPNDSALTLPVLPPAKTAIKTIIALNTLVFILNMIMGFVLNVMLLNM
jgi:hypothetical protein